MSIENDPYDVDIDDNGQVDEDINKPEEDTNPEPEPTQKGKVLSDEEYEEFQRIAQDRKLSELEREFKKEYPNFNMSEVISEFQKIQKDDPEKAKELFNKTGIEMVYLKNLKDKPIDTDDDFDVSRGMGGGTSVGDLILKMNKGEASEKETLELYKKIL